MQVGQLVNTNKTPTARGGRIIISTNKVLQVMDGAEVVTGKTGKKRKRQVMMEEGKFGQQMSLADLQQFVDIDQTDREESPMFKPVQESSPPEMPTSA